MQKSLTHEAIIIAIRHCMGFEHWPGDRKSQVQCPVLSVVNVVVVVSLSKELHSHCPSKSSCINGQISPISIASYCEEFSDFFQRSSSYIASAGETSLERFTVKISTTYIKVTQE